MKQLGRLLSIVTWLLVAGSVVILGGGVFGRPLLLAAVPTGSMEPVLTPGDLIVVLPLWAAADPAEGDVVVFKTAQDRAWVVHRIIAGDATEGFVTKGDANETADPYRVLPRDIAGVVPQPQGQALRLPRLGLLSIKSGPLSSPVVAGVALAMGLYLMVLDLKPSVKLPRWRQQRLQARPEALLSMYVGLAATAFVTTLVPAWTLSHRQTLRYEVVAQRPATSTKVGQYILGRPHSEEVRITNPSPLPLVVVFAPDDPHVTYAPRSAMLAPRSQRVFTVTVDNPEVGQYESQLNMGVFLPLLPPAILASLVGHSLTLAVLVTSLIPGVLILVLAMLDPRARTVVHRARARLVMRLPAWR